MRRSRAVLAAAILAATATLCALGVWQLQRLSWKQQLIATVEARRHAPAASLTEIEERWRASGDVAYMAATATGVYRHELEQYLYTTRKGAVGWDIVTPLELADGRFLLVNRGFVPNERRDPATRAQGLVTGEQQVEGLARNPLAKKPNPFVPDNEPARRTYFWRDLAAMAAAADIASGKLMPFSLDADDSAVPGGLPLGGSTIVELPNNHLQYAVTWFGLAACCAGVGGALLLRPARRDR